MAEVPPDLLARLEAGEAETATLADGLAVDFATLMGHVLPDLTASARTRIDASAGVTRRMAQAAALAFEALGPEAHPRLAAHPSDTVRGWAAFVVALLPTPGFATRLRMIRPLADDHHFGVREWAWLALHPAVVESPEAAIADLVPWVREPSPNLRRFAVETTRRAGSGAPMRRP